MRGASDESNETGFSVSPSKLESVLPLLGYELDAEGHIVDSDTGEIAKSPTGETLTVDEIGYLGSEQGNVVPVKDDISAITRYLSDRDIRGE